MLLFMSENNIPRAAAEIVISAFANVAAKAQDITLQYFCDTVTGRRPNKCADAIARLRRIDKATDRANYDRIKQSLPCVTISCRCTPGESHKAQEAFNGVWCIDIDAADNTHIPATAWGELRRAFAALPYCYLSALSAGGKGIFLLLAVDSTQEQPLLWEALQRHFSQTYGITLDKHCGNVNRLRFMSHDTEAVAKQPTTQFRAVSAPSALKMGKYTDRSAESRQNAPKWANMGDSTDRARAAVKLFCERGAILDDYGEWVEAAAALQGLPDGERLFDAMSRTSAKYDAAATQRKYAEASKLGRIGIGKLFYICERHGISEAEITAEWRGMGNEAQPPIGGKRYSVTNVTKRYSEQCVTPQSAKRWRDALDTAAQIIEAAPGDVERQVKEQDAQLWQAVYVGDNGSRAVSAEEMRRAFSPSEEAPASAPF